MLSFMTVLQKVSKGFDGETVGKKAKRSFQTFLVLIIHLQDNEASSVRWLIVKMPYNTDQM